MPKPSKRNTYADTSRQVLRSVEVRPSTIDEEQRSVEVVVATENPVRRFSYERNQVVDEILLMDGVEFRTSSRQLPIVDSHDRSTVKNVLGSVRNLRADGDELVGDAMFAADEDSQIAFQKLRDGHLTDFSITATPNEILFVPSGDSTVMRQQTISGPAEIVTRWRPTDASLVATGADERSVVRSDLRRSYELANQLGDDGMSPKLLNKLRTQLGMPEGITEQSDVEKWLDENADAIEVSEVSELAEAIEPGVATDATAETQIEETPSVEATADADQGELELAVDRALRTDRERQREIRALCEKARIERSVADDLCNSGVPLETARVKVLERMLNEPVGTSVRVTESQIDKTHDALRDGLVARAYTASGVSAKAPENPRADDFKYTSMLRMAETVLNSGGINTQRMAPKDVAMIAMGHEPTIHRHGIRRDGEGYHVSGTFSNLMLDAANKTLLAAYEEAEFTWGMWARQAQSVGDFKNVNRMRFSESPDLVAVPENHDYKEGAMSDEKESYKVEKFGRLFTVTWETVVNDDLDAISRIPAMQGNAARRTQNKKVYQVLTDNAAMADGTALFHSNHSNLAASAAVPSVTTLNAAYVSFMTQTGVGGEIIGVTPRYIIVPPSQSATTMQLLGSTADPAVGGSTAGNSNTSNIYGPTGGRALTLIVEPQLESSSTTAWYMAASNTSIDTVEIAFLQGEETPVLESEFVFAKDVWQYKVRQTFGIKAIDWRGLFKNAGA